mmetsp:Transcript_31888/g.74579  ORF Transcript_31888/g.74579 Transcript_31888/m.74579 type:complete len:611 (-) Transcript_31888:92-1924(-)
MEEEERSPTLELPYAARIRRTPSGRLLSCLFEYSPVTAQGGKGPKGKGIAKGRGKGDGKPTVSALEKHLISPWYSLDWNFHIERKESKLCYREEALEGALVPKEGESSMWQVALEDGTTVQLKLSGGGGSAVLSCVKSKGSEPAVTTEARKKGNVFVTEVLANAVVVKNHGLAAGDAATVQMTMESGCPESLRSACLVYVRPLPGNPSGRIELYDTAENASAERKRLEAPCLELIQSSETAPQWRVRAHCPNHGFLDGCPVVISGVVDKSKIDAKPWDMLNAEFVVADATQDTFMLRASAPQSAEYFDAKNCIAPSGRPFLFEAVSAKVCSVAGRWCYDGLEAAAPSYGNLIGAKRDFGSAAGMGQLLTSVESVLAQKELESLDAKDVDMTTNASAASAKRLCPRCEQEIPVDLFDSHWSSHSSEILPNLFLGGDRNAWNDAEVTKRTRITHILNVAAAETSTEELLRYYFTEKEGAVFKGYKGLPFQDSEGFNILASIDEAVEFVRAAIEADPSNHVLVHCVQGISRSASVVIAYLMGPPHHMSLKAAWEHVKARRSVARPNPAFIEQLAKLELRLRTDLPEATLTREDVWPPGETYLDLEKMGDAPLQ